jgi:S-layer protein (TIGR01567 family)
MNSKQLRYYSFLKGEIVKKQLKIFKVFYMLLIVCCILSTSIYAVSAEIQMANLNPDFIEYISTQENDHNKVFTTSLEIQSSIENYYTLGSIPSPLNLSHLSSLQSSDSGLLSIQSTLPSSFDLRDQNDVTPVRDQGHVGACWAFATIASLESNQLRTTGTEWDFSENHMKNLLNNWDGSSYENRFDYDDGGNAVMSLAYLSRGDGPVLESEDPYIDHYSQSPNSLQRAITFKNGYYLPLRTGPPGNNMIKQAIYNYGAVYSGMYWSYDATNYGTTYTTYYNPGLILDGGHAITVVGWDDTFSRYNFNESSIPDGDGAFIAKNSWGSGWGVNDGYFYISYYDQYFGEMENVLFLQGDSDNTYSNIYQYDMLGQTSNFGYGEPFAWAANVFESEADEVITAIGFYTTAPNTDYVIYIFRDLENPTISPLSNTIHPIAYHGEKEFAGYHTIEVDPVMIPENTTFSIVIQYTHESHLFPIPAESVVSGFSSQAISNAGESFASADGIIWEDFGESTGSICIKAFTVEPALDWVWEEGMPTTYIWDSTSFSGFHYDIRTGINTEKMIMDIPHSSRTVNNGDILYQTVPAETYFEYDSWGRYEVIGLMGEKYFAGYTENTSSSISWNGQEEIFSSGIISKILIDRNESEFIYANSSLVLGNGYEINIKQIDTEGNKMWVALLKDGTEVDDEILDPNSDFTYTADIWNIDDVTLIAVHFGDICDNEGLPGVFVRGIFQISENALVLENGTRYGKMEITALNENLIEMENWDSFILTRGETIPVMGIIGFIVADTDVLRFAPVASYPAPGEYKIRGTLAVDKKMAWTPSNFEGFCYNIDSGNTDSERLIILADLTAEQTIAPAGSLFYETTMQTSYFGDAIQFQTLGLFGKEFIPLTDNTPDKLAPLLINDDNTYVLKSNQSLMLANGFFVLPYKIDVEGSKVWLKLYQNGEFVDDEIIDTSGTWTYRLDSILGEDDVDILKIHVDSISSVTDSITIKGVWMIDLENAFEIVPYEEFGILEIETISNSMMLFRSIQDIDFRDNAGSKHIAGNLYFQVTNDSDQLRYYPFVTRDIVPVQVLNRTISIREISGLTPPVTGAFPVSSIYENSQYTGNVVWSPAHSPFQSETIYTAIVTLTPKEGFESEEVSADFFTVAGADEVNNDADSMIVNVVFPATLVNVQPPVSSGGSGGSGGGGGGMTSEPHENINVVEVRSESVMSGALVNYQLEKGDNILNDISFTAMQNLATLKLRVEILHERSQFANADPEGKVYKHVNIWFDRAGFAEGQHFKDAKVSFKVEKKWLEENGIDINSIRLNRYNNGKWNQLTTVMVDADILYYYFVADVPGFSPFSITGETATVSASGTDKTIIDVSLKGPGYVEVKEESSSKDKKPMLLYGSFFVLLVVAVSYGLLLKNRRNM